MASPWSSWTSCGLRREDKYGKFTKKAKSLAGITRTPGAFKGLTKDLQVTYSLSEEEVNEILQSAEKTIKESTSLYTYTRSVNDTFEYSKKIELIKGMWKIAYSDGTLDKYEEHLIRKVSDLIHLSHSDFINTKLEAKI